jgi:hypothetical protein
MEILHYLNITISHTTMSQTDHCKLRNHVQQSYWAVGLWVCRRRVKTVRCQLPRDLAACSFQLQKIFEDGASVREENP